MKNKERESEREREVHFKWGWLEGRSLTVIMGGKAVVQAAQGEKKESG